MPLRIFEGRAGTGKTTACLQEMKEKSAVLIVPEQYSFRMGKELLSDTPVTGFDGAQVYSFRRLATLLEGEVRGRSLTTMTGSERTLLISHLILKNKDRLQAIRPRLETATEMGELLAEFKKYCISPEDLRTAGEDLPDGLLKRKLEDALLLFEEYEKNEKMDGEDRLSLLAKNITSCEWLKESEVYIDQFTGFSPQEMEIIRALLSVAKKVTVVLTMDTSEEPQFELVRKTRKDLARMAEEMGEEVEVITFRENKKHQKGSALSFLEEEYFHYPHREFLDVPEGIEVFEASTRQSEIIHVAAAVTRLLKEGYRYRDIAVVSRTLADYETEIKREFERFDIPCFLDRKMPLVDHRASRAILSALETVAYGWKYEDIFRYIKCGYTSLSEDEIDRLENYCLASGVRGSAWLRPDPWDMPTETFRADDGQQQENEVDALRRRVAEPVGKLAHALSGEVTVREAAETLYLFMEEIRLPETLLEESKEGGRKGEEDALVYGELLSLLRALHSFLGEETVSVEHFLELLRVGLSQTSLGAIPHSLDHILLSDITRSKGSGAKVIFLIGVCDGIFPKEGAPQGFFSDSNRHLLEEKGLSLAPDSRGRAYMEQNLIYAALSSASDRLFVSYPVSDAEGGTLRPSRMIHRLKQLFPALLVKNDLRGTLPEDRITTAKGTFQPMALALRREKDGEETAGEDYKAALSWYRNAPEWQKETETMEAMLSEKMKAPRLSEEEARALYGNYLYTSISRLETYRACPYQYFAKYGLRLRARQVAGMNPADSGSFLHKILEDFSWRLNEKGLSWRELDEEKTEEILSEILPDIYERTNAYLLKESPRTAFLLHRLRKTAKTSIDVVKSHVKKGMFEPMGYELSFGEGGDLAPIEIPIRGGSCTLIGKIDRADKLKTPEGTFFRVVDYKSGSKSFDLGEAYYGLSLQLVVYLSALCENEKKKGENASPGGMVYFRIKDPVLSAEPSTPAEDIEKSLRKELKMDGMFLSDPDVLSAMDMEAEGWSEVIPVQKKKDGTFSGRNLATADAFRALFRHMENTVKNLAEEMLSGRIEAVPVRGLKEPCEYCEFRSVCGFDDKIECYRYEKTENLKQEEVWKRLGVEE